jgi:hypothetical protein
MKAPTRRSLFCFSSTALASRPTDLSPSRRVHLLLLAVTGQATVILSLAGFLTLTERETTRKKPGPHKTRWSPHAHRILQEWVLACSSISLNSSVQCHESHAARGACR